jgi:hypothetical protein
MSEMPQETFADDDAEVAAAPDRPEQGGMRRDVHVADLAVRRRSPLFGPGPRRFRGGPGGELLRCRAPENVAINFEVGMHQTIAHRDHEWPGNGCGL